MLQIFPFRLYLLDTHCTSFLPSNWNSSFWSGTEIGGCRLVFQRTVQPWLQPSWPDFAVLSLSLSVSILCRRMWYWKVCWKLQTTTLSHWNLILIPWGRTERERDRDSPLTSTSPRSFFLPVTHNCVLFLTSSLRHTQTAGRESTFVGSNRKRHIYGKTTRRRSLGFENEVDNTWLEVSFFLYI